MVTWRRNQRKLLISWIQLQSKFSKSARWNLEATFSIIENRHALKALVNEGPLLPTQTFPRLPAGATFVADTNFVSGTQKMFLILSRNILCPQQMFPSLRSMETQHSFCVPCVCAPKKHHEQQCVRNNVSSFARAFKLHETTKDIETKRDFR